MSIGRWMEKEVVVHIRNGMLLSHKRNTFELVLMRWMNLEPIIQSEVNQKEKDKYYILAHIYVAFRKIVLTILHTWRQRRHRYKEQTFGLCGRRGWNGLRESH